MRRALIFRLLLDSQMCFRVAWHNGLGGLLTPQVLYLCTVKERRTFAVVDVVLDILPDSSHLEQLPRRHYLTQVHHNAGSKPQSSLVKKIPTLIKTITSPQAQKATAPSPIPPSTPPTTPTCHPQHSPYPPQHTPCEPRRPGRSHTRKSQSPSD